MYRLLTAAALFAAIIQAQSTASTTATGCTTKCGSVANCTARASFYTCAKSNTDLCGPASSTTIECTSQLSACPSLTCGSLTNGATCDVKCPTPSGSGCTALQSAIPCYYTNYGVCGGAALVDAQCDAVRPTCTSLNCTYPIGSGFNGVQCSSKCPGVLTVSDKTACADGQTQMSCLYSNLAVCGGKDFVDFLCSMDKPQCPSLVCSAQSTGPGTDLIQCAAKCPNPTSADCNAIQTTATCSYNNLVLCGGKNYLDLLCVQAQFGCPTLKCAGSPAARIVSAALWAAFVVIAAVAAMI